MSSDRHPPDPATAYARAVVAGEIVAGRLVRLACDRHLRDLEEGEARGLRWEPEAGERVIAFMARWCRLAGGQFEGLPFNLQPWQAFIVASLFGWKRAATGYRRFRTAYLEIGKGNGKSPLAAAIGLYCLMADGEARAEVYAAATKKDQAMILFRDAVAMVQQSPALDGKLTLSGARGREWNIAHLASGSWFRPIASEDHGHSGPRPHCSLIDEIHEHKTPQVVDMLDAGIKGRRQPLTVEITNSGYDRDSVCWQHHDYSRQVLEGKLANDEWFAYVCGLDACEEHQAEGKGQPVESCSACDDWRDESKWPKANPNLGVSITLDYLRKQVREAEGIPSKEGTCRRLNLCWWTEGETAWLPAALWARGAGRIDRATLSRARCFGGLDIASKIDLAAFVLCFPHVPQLGHYSLLAWFWCPREVAIARTHEHGIPYLQWERDGWITLTPGDAIDQDRIEADIKALDAEFRIEDIGFDEWNASMLTAHLMGHGIRCVRFTQSTPSFTEPTKMTEALLREGKLHHGSHPVLDWCAGNTAVRTNPNGDIRPVKPEHGSAKKIDGMVAAVMSIGGALVRGGDSLYDSLYDSQGIDLV